MAKMPMVKSEEDMGLCIRTLRREGKSPEECERLCRAELEKNRKMGKGIHKMDNGGMMKDKEMMEY